jgi:mannose-6-phosphate isomerase-like protein (cupin superfamily)
VTDAGNGLERVTWLPLDESAEYLSEERCHILELSNSADDPAVSIARARVAPGVTTRPHSLDGTEERYLVMSGEGRARIGDEPPQLLATGDAVLIPPGVSQQIENTGDEDLVFLCICTPRFRWQNYRALD